ncbi:MAG: leucine-rich repeat domain-containing protein, partial [Bacteroidaceae bacterium]|nr:leucine-rich repeat domain-containing protein [Bacteroidaceae bacterium]
MVASMSVYAQDGVGYVPLTALDGMLSYGQYDQSHQEAYDKLVDANEQTRWGGWFNPALSDENSWPQNSEESANKMYIIVKTKDGEAVVPTSYFLVTGYDTGSYPGRNWASWKIYGGNFDSDEFAVREGEGWTLIDEREDEPLPAENYGTKDLNFNRADGTTAYKYYWIEIAKTVANSDIYIQMSEWGLGSYETFEQYLDRPTSVDEPVNYKFLSGSSGYAGEGAENLLDGNTATKWMYQFTNREKGQTSNGAYIVFRASRAMTPSYYTLSTANDTESHPGRNWKQWQIYGMNADNDESVTRDSEGWVLLDDKANVPTGNGINELPAANYASSFFTLSETNTEEYRYFKIEVDKIVSGGDMQMSEFALGDEYTCAFENIIFADANVKSICVNNWDTNGDGELSYGEAATVTSIGEVFKGNTSITIFDELQYFKGLISIGESAFQGCSSLTSIILPDGITTIGDDMFIDCSSLTSIIIPNGVTSIGYSAFDFCSNLTAITIPESVTIIGDYAFYGCDAINSVIVGMQTPIDLSMNSNTFGNYSNATLYVPTGSKAAYQSADVWKDFKEIMEYNYVDGSQDPPVSEFNAALAAITDGSYYLTTDVNGTKYYVTQNGHLTNDEESAYVFAISKVNASGAVSPLFDVAFLIDPGNGVHFSNPTPLLDGKAYLHLGFFYQDDHNNRNDWDRQVLFLNETGKFAIRSSNTPYDENSWLDAGRTFWTWEVGTDNSIIPCYSYEPAYIWTLEEAGAKEGFWTDAN